MDPQLTLMPAALHGRPLHRTNPKTRVHFGANPEAAVAALAVKKAGNPLWNALKHVLEAIDRDKILELGITDIGGMVLPRSALEWAERNLAMGVETFLREIDGTFNLLILPGILNRAAVAVVDHTPGLNPKGLFPGAWVQGTFLNHLGEHFERVVMDPTLKTPQAIRERFIQNVLEDLHQPDLGFLKQIPKQLAEPTSKKVTLPAEVSQAAAVDLGQTLDGGLHRVARPELNPEAKQRLAQLAERFRFHENPAHGMPDLDHLVQERLAQMPEAERTPKATQALRHRLSREYHPVRNDRLRQIADALHDLGFSNGVALGAPEKGLHLPLTQTVHGIDAFLQQYADRVLAHPKTGMVDDTPLTDALRQEMRDALMKPSGVPLWPTEGDGLIPYAHKQQMFLTGVPLALTTAAAYYFPKFNNWLTKMRQKGDESFPGLQTRASLRAHRSMTSMSRSNAPTAPGVPVRQVMTQLSTDIGRDPFSVFEQPAGQPVPAGGAA